MGIKILIVPVMTALYMAAALFLANEGTAAINHTHSYLMTVSQSVELVK